MDQPICAYSSLLDLQNLPGVYGPKTLQTVSQALFKKQNSGSHSELSLIVRPPNVVLFDPGATTYRNGASLARTRSR